MSHSAQSPRSPRRFSHIPTILQTLFGPPPRRPSSNHSAQLPFARRIRLEPLEDRRMLSTLFVDADATPGGDGLSWATAFDDLQAGLEAAEVANGDGDAGNDVDAIWIAEGVYRPTAQLEADDARSATFSLVDGVTLYGGFIGTETALGARAADVTLHETVLSGDLGVADDTADNAYTVVYCAAEVDAGIDGVTVVKGNAERPYSRTHLERAAGGAVYNCGSLHVANASLLNNMATYGGGIFNCGVLTMENSRISFNAASIHGGGIHNHGQLTMEGVTVSGNTARTGGGLDIADPAVITGCNISGNTASEVGGAMIVYDTTVSISNTNILMNSAPSGFGGGIYYYRTELALTNTTVSGNAADEGGGIWMNYSSWSEWRTVELNNTIVVGNSSTTDPDIRMSDRDYAELIGSNSVVGDGTGLPLQTGVDGNIVGTADEPIEDVLRLYQDADGVWQYELLPYSPAWNAGDNALAVDPEGNPLETDVLGNPRILDDIVDMGAVENPAPPDVPAQAYLVTSLANVIDAEDGELTFAEAFEAAESNMAIGDAPRGSYGEQDVIRFVDGLTGTIALDGEQIDIRGKLRIEGPGAEAIAFDGEELSRIFYVWSSAQVVLQGLTVKRGVETLGGGGGIFNCGSLVVRDCVIMQNRGTEGGGIRLESGELSLVNSALTDNVAIGYYGGGLYQRAGTLTVNDSTFTGNFAKHGGAFYQASGTSSLVNSTITRNSGVFGTSTAGGAAYLLAGEMSVRNSILSENSADSGGGIYQESGLLCIADSAILSENSAEDGGAIYLEAGVVHVINSTILANEAAAGAGFYGHGGNATIVNSVLSENVATGYGGGICQFAASVTTMNCTIIHNSASFGGGIAVIFDGAALSLSNTIIAENAAAGSPTDVLLGTGSITGSHNLISNGSGQTALIHGEDGNLIGTPESPVAPRFIRSPSDGGDGWGDNPDTPDIDESLNDDHGNLHLRPDSPAVDAGSNDLLPADEFDLDADGDTTEPIPFDLAGNARIQNGTVDMGAYEYVAPAFVPGDLNGDEVVNSGDLDIIRANWGRSVAAGSLLDGDPSGDGVVSGDDLDIVRANWGSTAPAAAGVDVVLGRGVESLKESPVGEDVYGPRRREVAKESLENMTGQDRRDIWAAAMDAWEKETERLKAEG